MGDIILEFIKNNYLVKINKILFKDEYTFYSDKDNLYLFCEVHDKNVFYKLYYYFINGFFYKIILNKDGKILSNFNGKSYVLLKYIEFDYDFKALISNNNLNFYDNNYKLNWRNVWINRAKYIEKSYKSIINKYNIVDESIDYFYGLLEASIYLLRDYDNYNSNLYLEHIKFNYLEFYNPCNIKLDIKERDFSNYLKYLFFTNKYKNCNIKSFIISNLNNYNFNIVLARLIYPDYYFDLYDNLLEGNNIINKLEYIILLVNDYEYYISCIYRILLENNAIKKVDFIDLH